MSMVLCIILILSLSSCALLANLGIGGESESPCKDGHSFSEEWSYDSVQHWHKAICEHSDAKGGLAMHSYVDGTCVCGAIEPSAHQHMYATSWSYDSFAHWHAATCEHSELKRDEAQHDFGSDFKCDTCGYEHKHTYSDEWEYDGNKHWREATCGHEVVFGEANHSYNADFACTECGYEHEHIFSEELSYDESRHWYASTCGHSVRSGEAEHELDESYACTTCDYQHKHTYSSDWSLDADKHWREATCGHEVVFGEANHSYNADFACTECGYEHEHTYSDEWEYDGNKHWHVATCGHEVVFGEGEHDYNADYRCEACGYEHKHTYSDEWESDANKHWHVATCGHDVRGEEASHTFVGGECFCGKMENHDHIYSEEWSYDANYHWHSATCGHDVTEDYGVHVYGDDFVCDTCSYVHEHTYSSEWSSDDNFHWHAATCAHTDIRSGEVAHEYNTATGNCICGRHIHVYSDEWSKDSNKHWHGATCEHTDLVADEAGHCYIDGFCVCGAEEPDYGPLPADKLESGTPIGTMTELFKMTNHVDASGRNCRVLQGGCSDGRYYYAFLNDSAKDSQGNHSPDSASTVYKYDMTTYKLVATYENVMVEHANDATYLPETNEILVANCSPTKNLITVLDADTMEQKRTFTIDFEIYAIAYDPYDGCYWVGLSYGDSFAKLDLEFNLIARYDGVSFGYTKQGMDVDSKYVYFSRYNPNCILVYDKEGNFVDRIGLSVTSNELENIFHIGDTFYLGYYTSSKGGKVYSLTLSDPSPSGSVAVNMTGNNELITLNRRTDADGNVCKVAQCSATDGSYIYFFMNNDVKANYVSSLYKYEIATGEIVATLDGFKTGHTNDVTYNSRTKELIVVQNSPTFTLTVIDAVTLEVKKDLTISADIYAIAYDEVNDCYYGAYRPTRGLIRLDNDFNIVAYLTEGVTTTYSRQAIDTDGKYIYMLQSAANCVLVFALDGTFVGISYLLPSVNTAQSICHIGSTFYIGYNVSDAGGIIYTTTINVTD